MAMIRLCLIDKLRAVAATGPLSMKDHEKSTQPRHALVAVFRSSDAIPGGSLGPMRTLDRWQRDTEERLTSGGSPSGHGMERNVVTTGSRRCRGCAGSTRIHGPDLQARPVHCYFFVFVSTGIAATK